jgi:hypothetical protein
MKHHDPLLTFYESSQLSRTLVAHYESAQPVMKHCPCETSRKCCPHEPSRYVTNNAIHTPYVLQCNHLKGGCLEVVQSILLVTKCML